MEDKRAKNRDRKRRQLERDAQDPERKFRKLDRMYLFGEVEVSVIVDKSEQIWFKGVDIARSLDMNNPNAEIHIYVPNDCRKSFKEVIPEYHRYSDIHPETTFITESGLNTFVVRSKMPKAEAFTKWVTEDVLPSIRKTNKYEIHPDLNPYKELSEYLQNQIKQMKEERELEREGFEKKLQLEKQEFEMKLQLEKQEFETKLQLEKQEFETKLQLEKEEFKNEKELQKHEFETKLQLEKKEFKNEKELQKQEFETKLQLEKEEFKKEKEEFKREIKTEKKKIESEKNKKDDIIYNLSTSIITMKRNCVPELDDERKTEYLVFIKDADLYHGCRIQEGSYTTTIKNLRKKNPDIIELLKIKTPNSVNSFNLLFEQLPFIERKGYTAFQINVAESDFLISIYNLYKATYGVEVFPINRII